MKEKKIWNGLKLLNPKNLEKEVHVYGYSFSWKSHILLILCSVLGIGAVGMVFKLQPVYFTVILASVLAALPILVVSMYKRMFEQKRFSDVVTYMEQMLYSFQKSGKVISALRETEGIFEEGHMKTAIRQAVEYIEAGWAKTEKGVMREALEFIETQYSCTKIRTVHEFLISGEEFGGNSENSIMLLLEDIEIWKRRGYRLQAEKKVSHKDNIISIIVSTILCAVALYVLDSMGQLFPEGDIGASIFQVPLIQISSFLFILAMLLVLIKSFQRLTVNWLCEEMLYGEEFILESYRNVMKYDDAKEKRKSLIFAVPFFVAAITFFFFSIKWPGIVCLALGALMLLQHRIGYRLAKKDVNSELYMTLPQWLLEIALLLQNNNVHVALSKSVEGAPAVLREELERLMIRIQENPDRLSSYTDFCKDFDIPEAQSCMKMLHAISESGTGNAEVQINNLLKRVNEMENMADQIRDENTSFKMKMIFSYPVLGATTKLLVDMTFGMVFMMGMLGNMGGM